MPAVLSWQTLPEGSLLRRRELNKIWTVVNRQEPCNGVYEPQAECALRREAAQRPEIRSRSSHCCCLLFFLKKQIFFSDLNLLMILFDFLLKINK